MKRTAKGVGLRRETPRAPGFKGKGRSKKEPSVALVALRWLRTRVRLCEPTSGPLSPVTRGSEARKLTGRRRSAAGEDGAGGGRAVSALGSVPTGFPLSVELLGNCGGWHRAASFHRCAEASRAR